MPSNRSEVAKRLSEINKTRRTNANRNARAAGLALRETGPGGEVRELVDWEDGRPIYVTTANANASISTSANLVNAAPYSVQGSNWTVGVWDAGGVRSTHVELTGRVSFGDTSGTNLNTHATHVAGTIAAAGVSSAAKGMAPDVDIISYDWDNDASETAALGASQGGEPGKIYISNHSYAYLSGWSYTYQSAPNAKWTWYGVGIDANATDPHFGQYSSYPRDVDSRLYSLPYYLIVWAAGNDRAENPAQGDLVALSPTSAPVPYDSALHPPGDGLYKSGYDTISFNGTAKNVLTIGAVNDAVVASQRHIGAAAMASFSCWGPTDDGRIKPDVVAN